MDDILLLQAGLKHRMVPRGYIGVRKARYTFVSHGHSKKTIGPLHRNRNSADPGRAGNVVGTLAGEPQGT